MIEFNIVNDSFPFQMGKCVNLEGVPRLSSRAYFTIVTSASTVFISFSAVNRPLMS
jgi:hypothetical protein